MISPGQLDSQQILDTILGLPFGAAKFGVENGGVVEEGEMLSGIVLHVDCVDVLEEVLGREMTVEDAYMVAAYCQVQKFFNHWRQYEWDDMIKEHGDAGLVSPLEEGSLANQRVQQSLTSRLRQMLVGFGAGTGSDQKSSK